MIFNYLISLKSIGQIQFKYSSFLPPYDALFKDKIMMELHLPKRTIPRERGGCS